MARRATHVIKPAQTLHFFVFLGTNLAHVHMQVTERKRGTAWIQGYRSQFYGTQACKPNNSELIVTYRYVHVYASKIHL